MEEKRDKGRPRSAIKRYKRSTTFPPSLYERLKALALRKECDVNDLIVAAVYDLVEREPGNNRPASVRP